MSIDHLMAERYDRRRNNCLHFAARAWTHLTGDPRLLEAREADIVALKPIMRLYAKVPGPTIEPSIVLMNDLHGDVHIGICLRRRLLHLPNSGPQFLPIEIAQGMYRNMRFYR